MAVSDLAVPAFWRELLERALRQGGQTVLPIIAAIVAGGPFNAEAVAIAAGVAVLVTVLKALAMVMVHPGEPWYWQLADRAVPAIAGTLFGFVSVDYSNIIRVDWGKVAAAALTAGLIALVTFYTNPPAAAHAVETVG